MTQTRDTTEVRLQSSSLVHAPGYIRWCMHLTHNDVTEKMRNNAVKLTYMLAAYPDAPAVFFMALIHEDATMTTEGSDLLITMRDDNAQ